MLMELAKKVTRRSLRRDSPVALDPYLDLGDTTKYKVTRRRHQSFSNRPRRKYQSKMKYLPTIIITIVLVTAEAKVVPANENQQIGTQPLQLSEYFKEVQNTLNTVGTQIQEHLNLPNRDEFINTVKEHSTHLANNIQSLIANTTEEVKAKTPELETLWTNVKNKLSEATEKLNINPETAEQVNQLRTKFQEGVQSIVSESQHVFAIANENAGKVQDDFKKIAKQLVEIAVQESQNLSNQLQQTATPQPQN